MTSILQFSDIHFGVEDKDALAAVHDMAESLKPDVHVLCGDITQTGKKSEFEAARDWIRQLRGPKVIAAGNHDTPMFNLFERVFCPFRLFDAYIKPLSEPAYVDQNVMIVPIHTPRGWRLKLDWSLGKINRDELDLRIQQMNATKPGTYKIVAGHHPLIYPEGSPLQGQTKNGKKALAYLAGQSIHAVMSGHVHAPFTVEHVYEHGDVLSIGSGTLSTRIRKKPASFNHVEVDAQSIKITAITWNGSEFQKVLSFEQDRLAKHAA